MDITTATIKELRDAGYAVIVWTPEELGSCPADFVEDGSIEHGWAIIEQLQDEEE